MRCSRRFTSALLLSYTMVMGIAQFDWPGLPTGLLIAPALAQSTGAVEAVASLTTIRQALKSGQVKLKVQGDGATTTKLSLQLTNTGTTPIKVVIPANEVLHPNTPSIQTMVITVDLVVPINPGETAIVTIPTVCGSPKTVPPPPEVTEGLNFDVGDYQNPAVWAKLAAIIAAGKELESVGAFGSLLMPSAELTQSNIDDEIKAEIKRRVDFFMSQNPTKLAAEADAEVRKDMEAIKLKAERTVSQRDKSKRIERITQLAIWRMLGIDSGKPEDAVTPGSMESDILKQLTQQIKMDKTLVTKLGGSVAKDGSFVPNSKQKEALAQSTQAIFDVVDLTVRRSSSSGLSGIASLPKDDPCDTFCSVGERAYGQGDFTEAQELLNSAVKLAEGFGEADARLSRSLNSLGLCYLNMTVFPDAKTCLERSLNLRVKVFGADSKEVAEVDNNLGVLDQITALYPPADQLFNTAVSIFEKTIGKTSDTVATGLNNWGKNLCLENKSDEGSAQLSRALALSILNCPEDAKGNRLYTPFVAEIETNLADAYRASGKNSEAAALYQKALATDVKTLGNEHPFIANILDGLSQVTAKQGSGADAENYKKQADGIRERTLESGSKDIAALPLSTKDLGRLWNYIQGKKDFQLSIASVKASTNAPLAQDATRMNRPIKDKWALVIGISRFKDGSINLQYAAKDAADFANYLTTEANFAPDHVRLLTNSKATRAEILNQLGGNWLPRVANPDDLVVIFFSSHGSPDSMDVGSVNYLVAYDTDKTNLYGTGISLQDFTNQIKKRVNSDRVVLVMDACHSGAAIGAKGIFKEQNLDASQVAQGSGQLVICSSGASQSSWESTRYKNGVFTHYLLEGLRRDNNLNKLSNVFDFMKSKVQEEVQMDRNGARQTPALQSKWIGNDLIVGVKPAEPRAGIPSDAFSVGAGVDNQNTKTLKPAAAPAGGASKAPVAPKAGLPAVKPNSAVKPAANKTASPTKGH